MNRTLDATNLNYAANHVDVRPWIKAQGDGEIDLTPYVADPNNFTFDVDHGGFLCVNKGNGVYEVHSMFAPEARKQSLRTMIDAMDFMFTRTDCITLVSHFPDGNPMADAIGKKGGFKFVFRMEEPPFGPCEVRVVHIDDWVARNKSLDAHGKRFHETLEAAKKTHLSLLAIHPDHDLHDRFVGAAVVMAERGQVTKGVNTYNRWAFANGYVPVTVVSILPPVVDVVDGVVSISPEGDLSVLLCR